MMLGLSINRSNTHRSNFTCCLLQMIGVDATCSVWTVPSSRGMLTRNISLALVLFFLDLANPILCSTSALRSLRMPMQSTLPNTSTHINHRNNVTSQRKTNTSNNSIFHSIAGTASRQPSYTYYQRPIYGTHIDITLTRQPCRSWVREEFRSRSCPRCLSQRTVLSSFRTPCKPGRTHAASCDRPRCRRTPGEQLPARSRTAARMAT
jgi:hypothetical protein